MVGAADLEVAITAYQNDGVAILRGVVSELWVETIRNAIERLMTEGRRGSDFSSPGDKRFFGDMFSWTTESEFAQFLTETNLPEIAARVMNAADVRLFYDQLFVKEPGTPARTPWHQDLAYWPIEGEQILSIWIPFDDASPENGVVTYVRGSHRWGKLYRPQAFSATGNRVAENGVKQSTEPMPALPDIDADPGSFELITWHMQPGDVLLHHPLTIHGAPGNATQDRRRRALSARYVGDDARWVERPGHFMRMPKVRQMMEALDIPDLQAGDSIDGKLFPRVWPK